MAKKKYYGTLQARMIEIPYDTKEEELEAAKLNKEIEKDSIRAFRGAFDWYYKESFFEQLLRFETGDLVKIFKTVTDGGIHWRGTVDLDRSDCHSGVQKGLSLEKWNSMFSRALPVKLERDGGVIHGALHPFCEPGIEGVIWAVSEYGKFGYDGLHKLENDDKLTVYGYVLDGEVEWEGELDFGSEKVSKIGRTEVLRETNHMNIQKWLELSLQNIPAVITPK